MACSTEDHTFMNYHVVTSRSKGKDMLIPDNKTISTTPGHKFIVVASQLIDIAAFLAIHSPADTHRITSWVYCMFGKPTSNCLMERK